MNISIEIKGLQEIKESADRVYDKAREVQRELTKLTILLSDLEAVAHEAEPREE